MSKLVLGGWYEHYKGGLYTVLHEAVHSETLEPQVVCLALKDSRVWVRPREMFLETVDVNGETRPRFRLLEREDL